VLVLKSNETWKFDISDCHGLLTVQNTAKTVYLKTFQPKPNTIDELKKVLQTIWDDQPQNSINKAVLSFIKRLPACVKAGGGHFEHCSQMTSPAVENYVCTVQVYHFTHFCHACKSDYSSGPSEARGPSSLNRLNPRFLRH